MRCPNCGTKNARETRLCVKCAQTLPGENGDANSPFSQSSAISSSGSTLSGPTFSSDASKAVASAIASKPVEAKTTAATPNEAAVAQMPAVVDDYKPSGDIGNSAPLLVAAALIGGIGAGAIYHFVARYFNLLLASQILAGLLVGGAVYFAIKIGKCRNPRIALTAASVGALLCFATFLTLNSQRMKPYLMMTQMMTQPASSFKSLTQLENSMTVPRTLSLYLQDNARTGVMLRNSHGGSSSAGGITLKGAWYWALLAFEIGLVVLTAAGIAQTAASARFCERCGVWWKNANVHRVHSSAATEMLSLAQQRDWNALRQVAAAKKPNDKQCCTAQMQHCPQCADGILKINLSEGSNVAKTVFQSALQPAETNALNAAR